jgi:hypothetical protein
VIPASRVCGPPTPPRGANSRLGAALRRSSPDRPLPDGASRARPRVRSSTRRRTALLRRLSRHPARPAARAHRQARAPLAQALRVDASPASRRRMARDAAVHRHRPCRRRRGVALAFPGVARAPPRSATLRRPAALGRRSRWPASRVLAAAALGLALAPIMPAEPRAIVYLVARPALTGGLALATAGVLCAELLRGVAAAGGARAERQECAKTEGSPA